MPPSRPRVRVTRYTCLVVCICICFAVSIFYCYGIGDAVRMQYEAGLRKFGITSTVIEDGDGTEIVMVDMPAGAIDISEQTAYLPVKRVVAGLELVEDEENYSTDTAGIQRRGLKRKKPLKMPPAVCGVGRKPCTDLGHPEICCPDSSRCLKTELALSGVYCCDTEECSDLDLDCSPGTFSCNAENDGGCCPIGSVCAPDRCLPLSDLPRYSSYIEAGATIVARAIQQSPSTITPLDSLSTSTATTPNNANSRRNQIPTVPIITTLPGYPITPSARRNPIITPAPPAYKRPDNDGDRLSGTKDPTEGTPSPSRFNTTPTTRIIRVANSDKEYTIVKTPEQPKMMVRPTVTEKNGRLRQGAPIRYDAGGGSYTGAAERVMGGCGRILVGVMGVVAVAGRRWG